MAVTKKYGRLLLLLLWSVSAASCTTCANTVKSMALSADKQLVARFYERNCGATTDLSSMVNLQSAKDAFNGSAGVLFVVKGKRDISIGWVGPRRLLVRCEACTRLDIFREVTALGDIDIDYDLPRGVQATPRKE